MPKVIKYFTCAEASEIVKKMGLKTYADYATRYKEYPGLPSDPHRLYGDEYPGWRVFSGGRKFYTSLADARTAIAVLGIKTWREYRVRYKEDPQLPSSPQVHYGNQFEGFDNLFGIVKKNKRESKKYKTYDEFESAVRVLGISGWTEYTVRYKEDPKLPRCPEQVYAAGWISWPKVFGRHWCSTWQECKAIAAQYRFTSRKAYEAGCANDYRLSKYPHTQYKDFPGWTLFLLPDEYASLEDVKCAVKILKIKNSTDYKEVRKKYTSLPAHPERMFSEKWLNWYDLCSIPQSYTYEELEEIVRLHSCKTIGEYKELIKNLKDPRIPSSPEEVYPEWINWYVLLGKEEPYSLEYIKGCGLSWIPSIQQFIKNQRAQEDKEKNICKFIRHFIVPFDLGKTPQEFLMRKTTDIRPFKEVIEGQASRQSGHALLITVNAYLNEILKNELTIEDEDSGELVRVGGANNPFETLEYKGEGTQGPSETTKPALAFQYVDTMKKWIVPESAKAFSDLTDLHNFDADYFEVNESEIDRSDPDCVFKIQGGKYLLWYPGYWMHAYALVSIPARGRQIAYNDSGESDEYVVDIVDEKLVWVKNKSALARRKNQQAFIYRYNEDSWGMHFTSNKTGFLGKGYDVPWAPEKLIYWMVKLRKWQEKYNPIRRAKPWLECSRTNMNEAQLKRKGANCFLFRAFKEEEPPCYTARLTERLAAALYFTQPKNLVLATFIEGGNRSTLSRYESKYTPHSMRVSLITAYVLEFGLPIEIIMKLAGHASVVMSVYYVKVGAAYFRRRMNEGEKLALRNQAYAAQEMLEQNRLDELLHEFVANSEQALQMLKAGNAGSTLVRDYGLCPYAAARCEDGGPLVVGTKNWLAVPAGYLGMQNCIRCRHFITGPMFLGGLLSLWNEISLSINFLAEHYLDFESEVGVCHEKIKVEDEIEYDLENSGGIFDSRERNRIELELRKVQSEKEGVAKKMDMFFCDLQMLTKQINECKALISEEAINDEGQVQLVVHAQNEIKVEIEETSLFQQLNEVCVNASIFQSASAVLATPRRSQMIDRMAQVNKIRPAMLSLNEREQLVVGNQVTKFLLQRLKTWERVDQLISGQILMDDLGDDERISKEEFSELMASKAPQLINLKEVLT